MDTGQLRRIIMLALVAGVVIFAILTLGDAIQSAASTPPPPDGYRADIAPEWVR